MGELPIREGFMIAILVGVGSLIAGILTCALKSRCTKIKCCCIECDRDVLPNPDPVIAPPTIEQHAI